MGVEAIVAVFTAGLGFLTWNHSQKQTILNDRFNSIKKRLEDTEKEINEFPKMYALKSDLNLGLSEIKDRLNHINDKLDQLILTKLHEKL